MSRFMPPKTVDLLASEWVKGTRHENAKHVALAMLGNQWTASEVFAELRQKCDADVSDKELRDIIRWSDGKHPAPSGFGNKGNTNGHYRPPAIIPPPAKPKSPIDHAKWWLSGATCTEQQFSKTSPITIATEPKEALRQALTSLYFGTDNLNIVCAFFEEGDKPRPHGPGKTLTRDGWLLWLDEKPIPESKAGAWLRLNPCREAGTGKAGAMTDSDVLTFRFLLIESDSLPIEMQLALYARLKLPIAAVLMSGGISAHAWVRIDAKTIEDYTEKVRRILSVLAPFGIDQGNKNPSRLSRLPGAIRKIKGVNGGLQKLLFLNPSASALEFNSEQFAESLLLPALEEKPFKKVIDEAIPRFERMIENQGRLGIQTGWPTWDKTTGGLMAGALIIIAADTGFGKTTLAINIANHNLKQGIGVAMFSMEMTREDICDMLFSLNCKVDRNSFNTGAFTNEDQQIMVQHAAIMRHWPLWIEDASCQSMEQIRSRTLQLKRENRIGIAMIDYTQLIMPANPRDLREQQVAQIAQALRVLAKDSQLPIVALSQVNEDGKFRESRAIGHEAAIGLLLSTKSGKRGDPKLRLQVTKGRKIPGKEIELEMEAKYCIIREVIIEREDMP